MGVAPRKSAQSSDHGSDYGGRREGECHSLLATNIRGSSRFRTDNTTQDWGLNHTARPAAELLGDAVRSADHGCCGCDVKDNGNDIQCRGRNPSSAVLQVSVRPDSSDPRAPTVYATSPDHHAIH